MIADSRVGRFVLLLLALLPAAACAGPGMPAPGAGAWALLLGVAQDGGLPHVACRCPQCAAADAHPRWASRVAALAIQSTDGRWWLIDATPDFPAQVAEMGGLPAGVFLTHAHMGHYAGLLYLGREALATHRLPVHCSARMAAFLRRNDPWRQLLALDQIELHEFADGASVPLDRELRLTPVRVPHRDELSDTHGFLVEGGGKRLLYLPDIDAWERWDRDLRTVVSEVDYALLDGTFYSAGELPWRDPREIPHPPCTRTIELLEPVCAAGGASVVFIHMNHSNPLWHVDGPEHRALPPAFTTGIARRSFPLH